MGTPIGNLEDMTFRAVRVLGEVDVIAAEDTRRARSLCAHFGVHRKIVSYHEHNRISAGERLVQMLRAGKSVGLVSDAGMPGVSDPGCELVSRCIDEGIRVTPVPGPSAAIAALVSSGLCSRGFVFEGFLPRARARRLETLRGLLGEPRPVVIYESPKRIGKTLGEIAEILGSRTVVIARELTKMHEEIIRAPALKAAAAVGPSPLGEFVIVVAGAADAGAAAKELANPATGADGADLAGRVEMFQNSGASRMDAIKAVAKESGMSKRAVYAEIERLKRERR